MMYNYVMTNLHHAGATSFDFPVANIREVALAKGSWGYPLTPQLTVSQTSLVRRIRSSVASRRSLSPLRRHFLDAQDKWSSRRPDTQHVEA